MKVYRFALLDVDHKPLMFTEVDEPDPKIDAEFWEAFLSDDNLIQYLGEFEEDDDV